MSAVDVEALLDSVAEEQAAKKSLSPENHDDRSRRDHGSRRDDRERDRRRDRRRSPTPPNRNVDEPGRYRRERPDSANSHRSHKNDDKHRDRDRDRRGRGRRGSDDVDGRGDYYRGGGRHRSRSPERDSYRPRDRDRERYDDRDRDRDRRDRRYRERDSHRRSSSRPKTPEPTEDERDRRTIFVQQLAARARTKDLHEFFSKAGPVKEAQIVKDRNMTRSKGIGYVEFKDEESVQKAIQMTGQKLLGVPIIAQLAEAEKNREARNNETTNNAANGVPFHRLYVGNIHFSIDEEDLKTVFAPFGEIEFVQLQKDEGGRSRGYGFVQFVESADAKQALDQLNGFDLAGRPIRVGLGNDKFTPESTANLLRNFDGRNRGDFQGSAFSGSGGRGAYAGGSGGTFDRAGGRDNDRGAGGASALDDTDVAGVNFSSFNRVSLMRKLARLDDEPSTNGKTDTRVQAKPAPTLTSQQASRCIVVRNAFDPTEETEENWAKEIEDDVKEKFNADFGKVLHISLDANSQGDIYVMFETPEGGKKALASLQGMFFNRKVLTASPVVEAVYTSMFPTAKRRLSPR